VKRMARKGKRTRVDGKVGHWGAVRGRVHMLTAIVGPGHQVGEIIEVKLVKVAPCPNWTCGGVEHHAQRSKRRESGK
jgi:hypothetical protein